MFTLITRSLLLIALNASFALAQVTDESGLPPNPVSSGGMLVRMGVMFVMVFLIFKVLVINPQKRKVEAQTKLAAELRKGDQVITTGGIIGRVVTIEKESITLEIAASVRVKFELASIVRRLEPQQAKEAA